MTVMTWCILSHCRQWKPNSPILYRIFKTTFLGYEMAMRDQENKAWSKSITVDFAAGPRRLYTFRSNLKFWSWWFSSSLARILREGSTINSPRALNFFFFKVEISSHTPVSLFRPGSVHSGSASWDDCDRVFPYELRVSSFPYRIPYCLDSTVSLLRLRWVPATCTFGRMTRVFYLPLR